MLLRGLMNDRSDTMSLDYTPDEEGNASSRGDDGFERKQMAAVNVNDLTVRTQGETSESNAHIL